MPSVAFQPAIEIVEVNAADPTGRPVVKLRGNRLTQRIMALLLPPADQIELSIEQLLPHRWQLLRVVLQVRVHREHHRALGRFKAFLQGRTLAVVAGKPYASNPVWIGRMQGLDDSPRTVAAPVINENDLEGKSLKGVVNAQLQLLQAFFFVEQRHDNADVQGWRSGGHVKRIQKDGCVC